MIVKKIGKNMTAFALSLCFGWQKIANLVLAYIRD